MSKLDNSNTKQLTVDRDDPELVGVAGLEPLHHDGVLVELVLSLDPGRLLQFPETFHIIY